MEYAEAFIRLFTDPDSPFIHIQTYNTFNIGALLGSLFDWLFFVLGQGLATFLNAMEEFANYCFKWLSFSENPIVVELYNVINKWLIVPLIISLIIIAYKYATADVTKQSHRNFFKNAAIVLVFVAFMPSVFSVINNELIGQDFFSTIVDSGSSTADRTLKNHTIDFMYLYDETDSLNTVFTTGKAPTDTGGNVDVDKIIEDLKTNRNNYASSTYSNSVSFEDLRFDVNEPLQDGNDGYSCPKFFQYKVIPYKGLVVDISKTENFYAIVPMDINGILGTGLGATYYQRYNIDFLNLYIQLIAQAFMYFCIGYSVLKVIFELIIHQIFGPVMAAMDLSGGQRIKKYLTSILGCYMSLLVSAIIVKLYSEVSSAIHQAGATGLAESLMLVCLAIIFLDGPNIIAKYFGISTGIKGGMLMAAAGASMMAKGAKKIGHAATAPARAGLAIGRTAVNTAVGDAVRNRLNRNTNSQREADAARREQHNVDQRNAASNDRYNQQMEDYTSSHGSDGNYEQYQEPKSYDPSDPGSDDNRVAITQNAAMNSTMDDKLQRNTDIKNTKTGSIPKNASQKDIDNSSGISKADINDAKQGIYSGISQEAEANGGTRDDYIKASEKALDKMNYSTGGSAEQNKQFAEYVADSSMNSAHNGEIRTQAKNLKAADGGQKNDVEYYAEAMKQSGYGFAPENCNSIATAELKNNGSLNSGNVYANRPKQPYQYQPNTQTRGLQ